MRRFIFLVLLLSLIMACSKQFNNSEPDIYNQLSSFLSTSDFSTLDRKGIYVYPVGNAGIKLVRAKLKGRELLVILTSSGRIQDGRILQFAFTPSDQLSGTIRVWNLEGGFLFKQDYQNGYALRSDNPIQVGRQSIGKTECTDCTIPEVIVATSYKNGESHTMTFYSLSWLFGSSWGYTSYLPIYTDGGGGGGPTELDPPIGNPDKIDPKKYTDCFDQISSDLATYSMTIYSDLPADQHPGTVFDHKAYYAGHSFIELNKSSPSSSARQVFGFYPGSRFGAISGGNTTSKIVDDSGHEFQASYTVTITQNQFNAAIQRVLQLNSQSYNITNFNCVDFALSVFQAGGGNMNLQTQYNIPVYGSSSGNNTPNGLYEQIAAMNAAGVAGTTANANKNYGPNGKGPCD